MKLMFWVLLAALVTIPFVVRHLERNALRNSGAAYELQIRPGDEHSKSLGQ